jgi:hypothetical protein
MRQMRHYLAVLFDVSHFLTLRSKSKTSNKRFLFSALGKEEFLTVILNSLKQFYFAIF